MNSLPVELEQEINKFSLEMNSENIEAVLEEIVEELDYYIQDTMFGKKIVISFSTDKKLYVPYFGFGSDTYDLLRDIFFNIRLYEEANGDFEEYCDLDCNEEADRDTLKDYFENAEMYKEYMDNVFLNDYGLIQAEYEIIKELLD